MLPEKPAKMAGLPKGVTMVLMRARFQNYLKGAAAAAAIGIAVPVALASPDDQHRMEYRLDAGDLGETLKAVSRISGKEIIFSSDVVLGKKARPLHGRLSADDAVKTLLEGTGLSAQYRSDVILIRATRHVSEVSPEASGGTQQILVTGSRIPGNEPASPIVVAKREDIERRGFTDLGGFARSLVQNFSGGQNPGIAASGQPGSENVTSSSALNLRGLGPDATLTLFNGHRVAYDAISQGVDISAVPLAAIDRIEVVTDGSSAVYGSDAVGGVANVILRKDFEGALVSSRFGAATDGGDVEQQYNIVTGKRWSSGGVMTAFDFRHSTPVTAAQRSYTQNLDKSETLINGQTQYSAVLAGHQAITDQLTFEVDGQFSDRTNALCINFTTTDGCRSSGSDAHAHTTSWTLTPTLKLMLPHTWQVRLSGTIGQSQVTTATDTYYESFYLDTSKGAYTNRINSLELNGEGPLFQFTGGPARLALGIGVRNTKLIARSIDYADGTATTYANFVLNRRTLYTFGEISLPVIAPEQDVPLMRRLTLTGAVRYEDVEDVGRVATPKLGLVASPEDGVTFKFSWGKSFKAPTLYQSGQARLGYSQNGATDYLPASPLPGTVLYLAGGNPQLKPEKATSWTVGTTLKPHLLEGLRLEVNYFQIKYRDRVVTPIPANYSVAFNPLYSNYVLFNPTPSQVQAAVSSVPVIFDNGGGDPRTANVAAIITNFLQNAARQTIEGVDAQLDYAFDLSHLDKIHVSATASYLKSEQQLTAEQPVTELAGTIFQPPHWRANSSLDWQRGNVSMTGVFSYIGGTTDTRLAPIASVGSYKTLDLITQIKTTEVVGPFKGITATLSLLNIFNEKPAFIRTSSAIGYHYDSTNYSTVGRFIGLAVSKML
jgi:iron complex outermembrane recepter protein